MITSINRVLTIAVKEFRHLWRDKRMLGVIIFFPVFLLFVFGYAVNFDVENISIGILDKDNSTLSREFRTALSTSRYFTESVSLNYDSELSTVVGENMVQCAIVIPKDFEKSFYRGETVPVQFIINGVDGNTASIIQNYLNAFTASFSTKYRNEMLESKGIHLNAPMDIRMVFWYNPELKSTKFLIPGLMAMILIMICVITVSLTLVREKERGTIEQLDVSPVNSGELLIGKTIPYILLSLLSGIFILIAGFVLFSVEVKGSYFHLLIATLLYISASTALGIFVSVIADSQQVAFTVATFASLLPSIMLSGFIFPLESTPIPVQVLSYITPAKYYIVALRAIILRGAGIHSFYISLISLVIFSLFFMLLANLINKKKALKV